MHSDIDQTFNQVVVFLETIHDEHDVCATIGSTLEQLRQRYKFQRDVFSEENIYRLKGLRTIFQNIREFVELRDAITDVRTCDDANEIIKRMLAIARNVGTVAVQKRVLKEIRALREKGVVLKRLDDERSIRRTRQEKSSLIAQLEKNSPRCACGHRMVIRESIYRYFWGCESFPRCFKCCPISYEEQILLDKR